MLAIILVIYSIRSLQSFSDFRPYYHAGERFLKGENLYNLTDGHYLFKYSPLAALFFAPFSILPYPIAALIWLILLWALITLSYFKAVRLEWKKGPVPLWALLLIILGISKFVLAEIHLGQVDFLLLFLTLVSISTLGKSTEALGGCWFAVAVLFKPPLLLILALMIWRKRAVFILGFLLTLLAGLCFPVLRYGLSGTLHLYQGWWAVLSTSSPGLLTSEVNQSIFGALNRWFISNPKGGVLLSLPPKTPLILGIGALICFLLYLWYRDRKYRGASELESPVPAMLLLGSVMFSPLGWVQNYVVALPVLVRTLNNVASEKFNNRWRLALLSLFFLMAVLPNFELLGRRLYDIYLGQSWIFLGMVCLTFANLLPAHGKHEA